MVQHDEIRWNVMKHNEIKIHQHILFLFINVQKGGTAVPIDVETSFMHMSHTNMNGHDVTTQLLELIKLMVHLNHEERIEREPIQRTCPYLVKIQYIIHKLDLQEFATCFSHSILDKTELWGHVTTKNYRPFTATRSTSTLPSHHLHRAWRFGPGCRVHIQYLIQFWKINILNSQRFGGLVWLVGRWFSGISLGWCFGGVPAVDFHGCMPRVCFSWVIINDHRWKLTVCESGDGLVSLDPVKLIPVVWNGNWSTVFRRSEVKQNVRKCMYNVHTI